MKRRRPEPVQGSMLTLMGHKDEAPTRGLFHGQAITKLVEDDQGNILEMSHEEVPHDDEESEAMWAAYDCPFNPEVK